MKIADSFKIALNKAFKNTTFMSRDSKEVTRLCNKTIKGSDTMVILPPMEVEVSKIDETHDKWSLVFEDATIECVVTWRKSSIRENCVVFEVVE